MRKSREKTGLILVHGGCGASPPSPLQLRIIQKAVARGYLLLQSGEEAVDAVEAAILVLEKSGRFNAGKGAARQMDGVPRMDASLMDGKNLSAGAVAGIEKIPTPIRVARLVMEKTPHLFMIGPWAERLARLSGIKTFSPPEEDGPKRGLRRGAENDKWTDLYENLSKMGTVGAVARDHAGSLAAGTSTGGIRLMLPGRVGDSPLIGAGTYADNDSAAVSMTGHGEAIIRAGSAKEISLWVEGGLSAKEAGIQSLLKMKKRIGGEAGTIILSKRGDFAILHTTPYMPAGYRLGKRQKIAAKFHHIPPEQ